MAAKKELTTDEKRTALRGLKTEYRRRTYWTDEVLPGLDKPGPAPGKLPSELEKELHAKRTLVRFRSRKLEREGKTADAAQMRAKQETWETKVVAPARKAAETDAMRQFMRTGLRASYLDRELAYRSFSGKPMTAQELLAKVYGSSGIPERALTQRLTNLRARRAESDALWNVKYTTPGRAVPRAPRLPNAPAELDLLGLGNPDTRPVAASLAQPRFAGGRRAFHQVGGHSYVPEGGMSASLHEAGGHGLNPTDNTGPTGEQLDGKFSRWYYWAGDAERGAFLGDLRKQVWMSQKTDTGDPKALQKVLKDAWDNPGRYKDMSPAVRKGLMQYHDLMEYTGPDQEVLDLKRRVEQMVKDESYVNQFASVGGSDTSAMAAAKAGDADRFARSRSFLAKDEVPESIFGVPVVAREEDYTPEDIAFFKKHPEAGGYYDMGDEEEQPPEESAGERPTQAASKGGDAETFDTPIPKELQARYDAWYAQLPKNLQYTGDYDLQGAWLEKLGQPDKYEATQNGHLDDYGKKPNHITFSTGSKWHDPKVPERTGGEWKRAEDGSWDFYPGTGNKASDDELKAYFDKYEKGNRVHRRKTSAPSLPAATNMSAPGGPAQTYEERRHGRP